MRLVTYRRNVLEEARLGALVDNLVVDIQWLGDAAGYDMPCDMLDFIDLGP
ncbi:MAG: FAA hydrolase family protein, partial [Pusillimonas sp.]|nr:FAA hydrolase family protein [Pusillimonas sp.]